MLWSHAGPLLPETWPSVLSANWFRPGFWGVTIFFAISGFLIIGQLLDVLMDRRQETLRVFVLRRWFRTVPTYWILLAVFSCTGIVIWFGWRALFLNALFVQGPMIGIPVLLPVSWSLVIEEWSYLFYAAFTALLLFFRRRYQISLCLIERSFLVLLLFLPCLTGVLRWLALDQGASVQMIKQGLFLQIDALTYGGLLAWWIRRSPENFNRLARSGNVILPLLIIIICGVSTSVPDLFRNVLDPLPQASRLWVAFGFYPTVGVLASALIVSSWKFRYSLLPSAVSRSFRELSRCSYSVYLLHMPLASLLLQFHMPTAVRLIAYLLGSIGIGSLSWHCLERPFMRLRARVC